MIRNKQFYGFFFRGTFRKMSVYHLKLWILLFYDTCDNMSCNINTLYILRLKLIRKKIKN